MLAAESENAAPRKRATRLRGSLILVAVSIATVVASGILLASTNPRVVNGEQFELFALGWMYPGLPLAAAVSIATIVIWLFLASAEKAKAIFRLLLISEVIATLGVQFLCAAREAGFIASQANNRINATVDLPSIK